MRLALFIVCALATTAAADTDLVFGPVSSGATPAQVKKAKDALAAAGVGKLADKSIDLVCATDPNCLADKGATLGARRVVGATVSPAAHGALKVSITIVDVEAKLLLGQRDITAPDKKLAAEIHRFAEEAPTEKAKALFEVANNHYNLGEFDQAVGLYRTAYRIKPLPAFLFNIAQCHRKLGQHKDAITMYQSYLAAFPDAQNKKLVESLIKESEDKLAVQQKADADKAAQAAQLEKERLDAEQKKAEEARKAKEAEAAAAEEQRKLEVVRIQHDKETYDHHPARKWMVVTSILSAGALGAGAYFGVQSNKKQQAFDSAGCGDPAQAALLSKAQYDQCISDRSTGQRDATLANAFLIGGGAALVGSILVFAIDPGNVSRPERHALRVTPTSVQWVMTW